jgi:hypothetical protein
MEDTDFDQAIEDSFSDFEDLDTGDEEANEDDEITLGDEESDENASKKKEGDEDDEELSDEEKKKKEEEEGAGKKPKKNNRLGKRFHKITEEKRLLRERLAVYEKQFGKIDKDALPPKPNPRQYGTEREYHDACVTWSADAKNATEAKQVKQEAKLASEQQTFQQKLATDKGKYKDFDEVVENFVETMGSEPLTPELHDAFCNDPNGTDLLYYFGKNPEILLDIYSMSATKAAMTLGKISERLGTVNKKTKSKNAVSKAPKPNTRLKPRGKRVVNLENCSMADYVKARRKQRK